VRRRTPAPAGPSGRSLRRSPPSSRPDPPRARQVDARGSQGCETSRPAATGGLSPAGVRRPMSCLPLTDPASRQQVVTFTSARLEMSRLTNGVRDRGPRLSGGTAGGAAPYGPARGPILRGTPGGTRTFRHGARVCGKHVPWSPKAPRRPVGLARHRSAHATAARAGTSRARPSRTDEAPSHTASAAGLGLRRGPLHRPARETEAQVARGSDFETNPRAA
jgi:hypothetical protein